MKILCFLVSLLSVASSTLASSTLAANGDYYVRADGPHLVMQQLAGHDTSSDPPRAIRYGAPSSHGAPWVADPLP